MAKKKKLSSSFKIGVFVLLGLSLLVAFILWMGATQFFKKYDFYVTYFSESVVGLENGSSVKYMGVPCGMISEIDIASDGKLVQVVFKIEQGKVKLTDDMLCKMEMSGLAGGKFLQLTSNNGKVNNFDLSGINIPKGMILIPSAPSQLDAIAETASNVVGELSSIEWKQMSEDLSGTLVGTNRLVNNNDLAVIVGNLKTTTDELKILVASLNNSNITNDIQNASESIERTASKLEDFSTTLNNKVDSININKYLDQIYGDVNNTMNRANTAIDGINKRVQTSFMGINYVLDDISHTNNMLQTTLRTFNESPYLLLTNPPEPDKIKK